MKVFLFALIVLLVHCQYYEADRVHETHTKYTGYPWYSGYLSIGKGKNHHYVFFTSKHDPDTDPIVIWYNGGPGCSSLLGMTTELGPFIFPQNSTSPVLNPHSWNKEANLLFIESPGSVGFTVGGYEHSDESTAEDNLQTILEFYSKFPVMRKNKVYLAGESYAGVYVPTLAKQIDNYNQHHGNLFKINLAGIMVGNACTHRSECYDPRPGTSMFQYEFMYNHGFFTDSMYSRLRAACVLAYKSDRCKEIRDELDDFFDTTFTNIYSIYDKCYDSHGPTGLHMTQSGNLKERADCNPARGSEEFFNNPVIRDALHVYEYFNGTWEACNHTVYKYYKKNENQSYSIYPELMKAGYRVWVYSGDTDADVPITGTKSWIQQLREQFHVPVMEPWREWWVYGKHAGEDQVGGMVWKLRNLTFVSVKNAGHMVPQDQPEAALVMLNAFLKGEDLPERYEI